MISNLFFLFFTALFAGLLVLLIPKGKEFNIKLTLVFAGSYLFSITIIHILPELFSGDHTPAGIGIFILLGFFLQLLLEYFTAGVEHGHLHHTSHSNHNHVHVSPIVLLSALCLHAFLEGTLLSHPSDLHQHNDAKALLLGIIIHKMPAAFALMTVLLYELKNRNKAIIYLVIFCLASPLGLLTSHIFNQNELISESSFTILYAVVGGNFLHISTTIFFESSPEHKFNAKKLGISLLGAMIAVLAEYFM
ncbi:MAG: ZIP family metal transporter [Bacteroidota bacterium]|nr:ZIP family metal transporter [Bacteroidota bacterium]